MDEVCGSHVLGQLPEPGLQSAQAAGAAVMGLHPDMELRSIDPVHDHHGAPLRRSVWPQADALPLVAGVDQGLPKPLRSLWEKG